MKHTWLSVPLLVASLAMSAPVFAQSPSLVVPATTEAQEQANVQKALAAIAAVNARTFEQLDQLMAPSFTYTDPALPGAVPTQGFVQFLQGFIAGFPDLHYTVERVVPRGDTVVLFVTAQGTFSKPFTIAPGKVAAPNNRTTSLHLVNVYDFHDGRIVRGQSYWDVAGFLGVLGPTP